MGKIVFFDIDGTLKSETTKNVPESAVIAIQKARRNGHLMFINTGRCFCNIEELYHQIGFDGYVCGCGTHIVIHGKTVFHVKQTEAVCRKITEAARKCRLDLIFEAKDFLCADLSRPLRERAKSLYDIFVNAGYDMSRRPDDAGFQADKFVVWEEADSDFSSFLKTAEQSFDWIDRGDRFHEFVPKGYSKATGIQAVLNELGIDLENAYAVGDSNNDLAMLSYVPNSIAMGNSHPESLKEKVRFVTRDVDEDGIAAALEHFGFL